MARKREESTLEWWEKLSTVDKVIVKESADLMEIWRKDPAFVRKYWPEVVVRGKVTYKSIGAVMRPHIKKRYAGGKCSLCDGNAFECAPRHARGRSCA